MSKLQFLIIIIVFVAWSTESLEGVQVQNIFLTKIISVLLYL